MSKLKEVQQKLKLNPEISKLWQSDTTSQKNSFLMENLNLKIGSFSELKENWDSYHAREISMPSIMTAHKVVRSLQPFFGVYDIDASPMRDGGVQIEIGDFKEIEICNYSVKEITFDAKFNIIKTFLYNIN